MLDEKQESDALEYADGFLRKPFSVDELHSAIDSGFKRRDVLKRLAEIVGSNKELLHLITGKAPLEKIVEKAQQKEASDLFQMLKAS